MTIKLTATEAKAKMLALLDQVSAGEEVEITKHGRTVARLVGANSSKSLEGDLAGLAMTAASEEQLFSTDAPWKAR